jgi:hypothetical protein
MNKTRIKNFRKMVNLVKRRAKTRRYWKDYWEINKDILLVKKAERYYTVPEYREGIRKRTTINTTVQNFLDAVKRLYREAHYEGEEENHES